MGLSEDKILSRHSVCSPSMGHPRGAVQGAAGELASGSERALGHRKALEATQERRSTVRRRHGHETEPEEGRHSKVRREQKD